MLAGAYYESEGRGVTCEALDISVVAARCVDGDCATCTGGGEGRWKGVERGRFERFVIGRVW